MWNFSGDSKVLKGILVSEKLTGMYKVSCCELTVEFG